MQNWSRRSVGAALAIAAGLICSRVDAVSIDVGSVTGTPGSTVTITVTLSTMGDQVLGTINNIAFDPATPIVKCTPNPLFALSGAILQPEGCTAGVDCQHVRAAIIQFSTQPIADGTVLYFCDVQIAVNAAVKSFPLTCSDQSAGGPNGALTVSCSDGQIQVVPCGGAGEPACPTATPTPTQTLMATATRTATGTPVPGVGGGGGGGGACAIAAPRDHGSLWTLLIPILGLILMKRRR